MRQKEEKKKIKKGKKSREDPALENKKTSFVIYFYYSFLQYVHVVLLTDKVFVFSLECVCSLVSPDRGSLAFN